MPAVSVIMPAYNVEAYLADAIDSVLGQTFTDYEILVIDDGATDGTSAIADAYAHRDARVRVFHKPNGGISSSRNHALRHARGELIALLDGDDLWEPAFLETQVDILQRRPDVDILTANAWNLGGRRSTQAARPWPDARPHPDLLQIIADEEAVFIMCVFRRRVYETIGEFDESLRTNEDYDYWLRAALQGFRFFRNPQPLARYRRRNDSLSASQINMLHGILKVYRKFRPSLADKPLEQSVLDAQIGRFETECLQAEVCWAIANGDMRAAAKHLADLRKRRGGARATVAHLMARWTPRLLSRAYHWRSSLREAS